MNHMLNTPACSMSSSPGAGAARVHSRPSADRLGPVTHRGFLSGTTERQVTVRPTRPKPTEHRPQTPTGAGVRRILDACDRVRARLLMASMFEMRVKDPHNGLLITQQCHWRDRRERTVAGPRSEPGDASPNPGDVDHRAGRP